MPLFSRDESFALARELVAKSPAAETEVTVESTVDRFVRYAGVGPTQSADRERVDVAIRVRVEKNGGVGEARAEAATLERSALERTLGHALELAEAAVAPLQLIPLGGPVEVEESCAAPASLAHPFEAKADAVARALARSREAGFAPAGLFETWSATRALVNSRGREVFGANSRASFSIVASGPTSSGFADTIDADVANLDVAGAIERALEDAARSRDPSPIEPGEYEVVLGPHAASALLLFLAYEGLSARALEERTSFLAGRVGEPLAADAFDLVDDARHPKNPGWLFDGEGTARERRILFERGRALGVVSDRAHAHLTDGRSTGHALPQPSNSGPLPQNLVVGAGVSSLEELIARVERGLFITQLHYVNSIEPRELVLTGVIRHGAWRIEQGRLAAPVSGLRFTDSLVRVLKDLRGVGSELVRCGALFDGEVATPALHLGSLRFTSSTRGA
ncbi:MAG: TldD/PmbA family protein [Planctomycetes bacterium]|nr:TldD/PmbA family protein [Planctomycetota bacterium]